MYGPEFHLTLHCDLQGVWAHQYVLVVGQKNLLATYDNRRTPELEGEKKEMAWLPLLHLFA